MYEWENDDKCFKCSSRVEKCDIRTSAFTIRKLRSFIACSKMSDFLSVSCDQCSVLCYVLLGETASQLVKNIRAVVKTSWIILITLCTTYCTGSGAPSVTDWFNFSATKADTEYLSYHMLSPSVMQYMCLAKIHLPYFFPTAVRKLFYH